MAAKGVKEAGGSTKVAKKGLKTIIHDTFQVCWHHCGPLAPISLTVILPFRRALSKCEHSLNQIQSMGYVII